MGNDAAHLTLRLLEPDETRLRELEDFVRKRPDFAPAVYHLSHEYSQQKLGAQTLSDKAREKELLARFHDLVDEGDLLRHFLDQKLADQMLADAKTRHTALQAIDEHILRNPVTFVGQLTGNTWTITISIAEPACEIMYGVGPPSFVSTGHHLQLRDQRTGKLQPKMQFEIPGKSAATKFFVKYTNLRGVEQGPYELAFDPQELAFLSAKSQLEQSPNSWIAFRDFNGSEWCTLATCYPTEYVCPRSATASERMI